MDKIFITAIISFLLISSVAFSQRSITDRTRAEAVPFLVQQEAVSTQPSTQPVLKLPDGMRSTVINTTFLILNILLIIGGIVTILMPVLGIYSIILGIVEIVVGAMLILFSVGVVA